MKTIDIQKVKTFVSNIGPVLHELDRALVEELGELIPKDRVSADALRRLDLNEIERVGRVAIDHPVVLVDQRVDGHGLVSAVELAKAADPVVTTLRHLAKGLDDLARAAQADAASVAKGVLMATQVVERRIGPAAPVADFEKLGRAKRSRAKKQTHPALPPAPDKKT